MDSSRTEEDLGKAGNKYVTSKIGLLGFTVLQ
jgi:hypothetical protein